MIQNDDELQVQHLRDAQLVISAIDYAKQHGLELEFVDSLLFELKAGHTVDDAIYFAMYEWDL